MSAEMRRLICRRAAENPTWGEERIADELFLKLHIRLSSRTVGSVMRRKSGLFVLAGLLVLRMRRLSFVRRLFALPAMAVLLVPAAFAQYTGTVSFTSTLQQIDGFGVAATFGRPWYIESASGSVPSQIVDQLFNPVSGAGIPCLRMGIDDIVSGSPSDSGSSANSGILIVNTAPVSCNVTPTYTGDGSAGGEVWLSQQAVKYGVKRFYADSWGAPGYMKTNNSLYSRRGRLRRYKRHRVGHTVLAGRIFRLSRGLCELSRAIR